MYTINERVGASRSDRNGDLKLAAALDLLQDCSMYWMESEPEFRDYLIQSGCVMVLASRQADIQRLPRYGENVTVTTSIFDVKSYLGYRNTVICGEDGGPCILSWSVGAFVDTATGKMARLPPVVAASLVYDEKAGMDYRDKKIVLPDNGEKRLAALPVRRCDIDINGHMNNARYVEAALELLPAGFQVRRLRVEYKKAAMPGGLLYPLVYEAEDICFIVLADEKGRAYTVMEFMR